MAKKSTRVNKSTGYRGIRLIRRSGKYRPSLKYKGVRVEFPDFDTVEEALEARNNFIRNKPDLPSKYSIQDLIK